MLPTPSHLVDCTHPTPEKADDCSYAGDVRCGCGSDVFELHATVDNDNAEKKTYASVVRIGSEYFFRVEARCSGCGRAYLLIDMDLHGWEGLLCTDDAKRALPRPELTVWACRSCQQTRFTADVMVQGETMDNAIEESEGELDESNWQDGFGWISINIRCADCGSEEPEWVSYETM